MKALQIEHDEVTRESLLRVAEEIPGAWIGIRIAAYLLILSGWKSSQVADLFGLTRWAVIKWINKANERGVEAAKDMPRIGRPSRLDSKLKKKLEEALSKSPKEFGIPRVRWDGIVVSEYFKRFHNMTLHVRHSQRLIRALGFSLRQPLYRFVQATKEGTEEFRAEIKKTSRGSEKRRKKSNTL